MNNLNQITSATREGLLTVAGSYHGSPRTVTVNGSAANRYADGTFASTCHGLVDGTNTLTAVATDIYALRSVTNIALVYSPAVRAFNYDLNGNLVFDGQRAFIYDHENQLIQVLVTNAWKSEFVYDGKMRRRIRREFTWSAGGWVQTNEVRYVYDGNLVIQERNASNVPKVTYTRGKDLSGTLEGAGGIGGLLARTENKSPFSLKPATHAFYHADGNGNVTMLIDSQQAVAANN